MLFESAKFLVPVFVLYLVFLYFKKISPDKELVIIALFILSRLVFSSFHEITFAPMIGGLSLNALHSIAFCFIFSLYLPNISIFFKVNALISLVILFMIVSAVYNGTILISIVSVTKWILLGELIVLIGIAFEKNAPHRFFMTLIIVYLHPLILFILSLLLGEAKAGESDGSSSYVGGFYHEAVFSMIIMSSMIFCFVLFYLFNVSKKITLGLCFIYLIFLLLVNYRTTVLAAAMMLLMFLLAYYRRSGFAWLALMSAFIFLPVFIGSVLNSELALRFEALPQAVSVMGEILGAPELFYKEEVKLLSGRLFIWSEYLEYVANADTINQWIGHGMDSWRRVFAKYAHNTFVSFYYELGIMGLALVIVFFIAQYKQILGVQHAGLKIAYVGIATGFLFLNLATMPLWAVEGIFLFACISSSAKYFSAKDIYRKQDRELYGYGRSS